MAGMQTAMCSAHATARPMLRRAGGLLALATLFGTAVFGCAGRGSGGEAEAVVAPPASVVVSYRAGDLLGSPAAAADPAPDDAGLIAECRFDATTAAAGERLAPLGTRARLITASRVDQPVLPSTRLTRQARFAEGDLAASEPSGDLPAAATIANQSAGVRPGAVTKFTFASSGEGAADAPVIEVEVFSPAIAAGKASLAISVTDAVIADDDEDRDEAPATRPAAAATVVMQRESAIVDDLTLAGDPPRQTVTLAVPYRFPSPTAPSRTGRREKLAVPDLLWIELTLRPGDAAAEADAALLADARAGVARALAAAAAPRPTDSQLGARSLVEAAMPMLAEPATQRRALSYLAAETGAAICQDAALVADDEVLARLATTIVEQAAATRDQPAGVAQWGLTLDLCTIKVLAEMQSAGHLPAELQSVLTIHTGEVGRRAGSAEELLGGGVASRADLNNRLVAENLIALEDNSPAARVRAYDWLATRGRAPEGFDPLGPARARRDALEKAFASPSTQPAAAATAAR